MIAKPNGTHRDTRSRDAKRKRSERLLEREVRIPACRSRSRRERLEADDEAWLKWYFGPRRGCDKRDTFWYPFTAQQQEMIEAIREAIVYGGDQSLAASRGEGKTTLMERLFLKYTLQGVISFSVLCAATGTAAGNSLESIRDAIETNPRLLADYPEVCVPVQALENTPNRAHYQVVTGRRHDTKERYSQQSSRFSWCGQEVIFPNVPGSPSAGAIIATRGLDAAVRGLKRKGKRPDVVGIDDPDTEDTARSEEQADKLETRIDRALGMLGGQQKTVGRVMLTTLQNRICVSYRFTDPEQKPTWNGKRFRFLLTKPAREDLWTEYIQLRQQDMQTDDSFGRTAHRFYLAKRAAMDVGAEVANAHRFDATRLPDGSHMEVSALQHYYNEIARIGEDAVAAEYDNNPSDEDEAAGTRLTVARVQKQLSHHPRGIVPPGCSYVTSAIDVGKRYCHWLVDAWRVDATRYRIDYSVQEVWGTHTHSDDRAIDKAILRALHEWRETTLAAPYCLADGEVQPINLVLIDAHYRQEAVYQFCREVGHRGYRPAMGFGQSGDGATRANFTMPSKGNKSKKLGDRWFLSEQPASKIWLVCVDTDHWRRWTHDRYLTPTDRPGASMLYGDEGHKHLSMAKHLTANEEVEEFVRGKGVVRLWKPTSPNDHWGDADYLSAVAASMLGVRLLKPPGANGSRKRVKLSDLRKQKRQA